MNTVSWLTAAISLCYILVVAGLVTAAIGVFGKKRRPYVIVAGVIVAIVSLIPTGAIWEHRNQLKYDQAVTSDLSIRYRDQVRITKTDPDTNAISFDILNRDGSLEIHCDGTLVKDPAGSFVIARDSLTPACAGTLRNPN